MLFDISSKTLFSLPVRTAQRLSCARILGARTVIACLTAENFSLAFFNL
jgi:hypothetical protein